MRQGTLALIAVFSWVSSSAVAEKQENRSLAGDGETAGFVEMFNGKDLEGWRAFPPDTSSDWSVRDGVVLGGGTEDRLAYLVWKDEDLTDFELKFSYRMLTEGNTGVEIRSRVDATGKRPFEGYHADLGHVGIGPHILGAWDFHFAKRKEFPCPRGTRLVIDAEGEGHPSRIEGALTRADVNERQWNDVHVIARGQHFQFWINGKLSSEFTDNYAGDRLERGAIALQLHDKGMEVAFKDLRLKKLPVAGRSDDNWPRFRGPQATGVARDHPLLPDRWSPTENVRWKAEIPGWGWSSPVVWGKRVFLTTVTSEGNYEKPKKGLYKGKGRKEPPKGEHRWLIYCLDVESGEVLWKREAHKGEPESARHPKSTYASETPTTDGERLYALFGDVGLYCYDMKGELLWSSPIDPRTTFYDYGAAASPVVHNGQVIMVYDNQEDSYIAAFDARTGARRWRTERQEMSTWATPLVWENDLRTEIVTAGKRRIRSYDLRGKLLWELDGQMSNLIIPSPLASLGLVYVTSGYIGDRHRPVYAIKPGAGGDITPQEGERSGEFIRWYQPTAGPYNPSPIVYRGHYYTLLDRGFMTCHDARSGEELYGKTRLPVGSSFTSSPWAYNGKIFCLSEDGDTYVIQAGKDFELLHSNSLNELCMASPAACQGKLFVRTASKLYCFSRPAGS